MPTDGRLQAIERPIEGHPQIVVDFLDVDGLEPRQPRLEMALDAVAAAYTVDVAERTTSEVSRRLYFFKRAVSLCWIIFTTSAGT